MKIYEAINPFMVECAISDAIEFLDSPFSVGPPTIGRMDDSASEFVCQFSIEDVDGESFDLFVSVNGATVHLDAKAEQRAVGRVRIGLDVNDSPEIVTVSDRIAVADYWSIEIQPFIFRIAVQIAKMFDSHRIQMATDALLGRD
jgi:hypothetical protein